MILFSGTDGSELWRASGAKAWDWFGLSVAQISDIDNDGAPEIVVAGESGFGLADRRPFVRVLSGSSGKQIYEVLP